MGVLLVLALVLAVGGRLEASTTEVPSRGFSMDHLMSMNGCGRFAGLVNATANATETFQRSSLAHGRLILFCPDDNAVAAFDKVGADSQLAVLLYHGVAAASLKDGRPTPTRALTVPTLATDLADGGYGLTVRHRRYATELSSSSGGVARVTSRMVTGQEEETLVVYLIDAVLLPRESVDGGDSSFNQVPLPCYLVRAVALFMWFYLLEPVEL